MPYPNLALFLLRFTIGSIVMLHGYPKLIKLSVYSQKMPGGTPITLLVGLGELLGGAALVFGILPKLAGLGLVIILAGSIFFTIKWKKKFLSGEHTGWDYNLLLLIGSLVIALVGGGAWILV